MRYFGSKGRKIISYWWESLYRNMQLPPVLANSIPKAGTHLLSLCLSRIPGLVQFPSHVDLTIPDHRIQKQLDDLRSGTFLTAHLPFRDLYHDSLIAKNGVVFLLIRDPRDIVVSHFYYVTYRFQKHHLNQFYASLPSDSDRLMASIQGVKQGNPPLENIATRYRDFLSWCDKGAIIIQFEELVGQAGGGTLSKQVMTIRHIAQSVGIHLASAQVNKIANEIYNPRSTTFRKGVIGDFRSHFADKHKDAFKTIACDLLIELGYETSDDW